MAHSPDLGGRATKRVWPAVDAYIEIARRHSLDLAQMSLAWCRTRQFMGSAIFGATNAKQLDHLLKAAEVSISDECLADIDQAHRGASHAVLIDR